MLVLEYKIKAKPQQYKAIDEAITTVQFIRVRRESRV
jgi:putative transposase